MTVSRRRQGTRESILEVATARLTGHGLAALTLDAVGAEVGITKQAVLYHFGTKERLVNEILVERLVGESAVLCAAVEGAKDATEAIERFVLAFVDHYRADLPGFRLCYVLGQASPGVEGLLPEYRTRLHTATGAAYSALEKAIRADARTPRDVDPRRLAVSIHLAAIGHLLLHGAAEAAKDPILHGVRPLALELVRTLAHAWR